MADVVVIGCGAVGLPLAVALASRGATVLGVDIDAARADALRRGETGMLDAGLAPALRDALDQDRISFAKAAPPAEAMRAWIIAVPTPVGADQRLDQGPLNAARDMILAAARPGDAVLMRSTVPVGRTRRLAEEAADHDLVFAACPDRSLAGQAFGDQFAIPNIVGGLDAAGTRTATALLAPLGEVVQVSTPETAEALKLFANVWRDAHFAMANQLALFSETVGLDFEEIRAAGAAGFPRFDLPRAGPVGGPCLTKDAHLLAQSAAEGGGDVDLLLAARRLNQGLADHVARSVLAEPKRSPGPRQIAVLGLGFKGRPATLDRRGSIGVEIAARLAEADPGADIRLWDPVSDSGDGAQALAEADIVVLANDHPALADPARLAGCAKGAAVFDLCGVLSAPIRSDLTIRRFGKGGVTR
jgi:nucleotide sugar dehydrogenase